MAGAAAAVIALAALPALADVKAGVDAWARGDYAKAVAEWRGPALAGDADAEFNMGQAYKLGRGVPTDLAQAEEWYRKAALKGHAQAQDNYALALFQRGQKADALGWLEKAVARDERRTELVLGTMLFNGDSVPKDWTRAYALVSRSSQQGLPQAGQTLAQMDGYLAPEQRQQGTALAAQIAAQARSAQLASLAPPQTPPQAPPHAPPRAAAPATSGARTPDLPDAKGPPAGTIALADLPPSRTSGLRPPEPHPTEPAQERPKRAMRAADAAPLHAVPVRAAPAGRWRVQLGAFRDEGHARALWSTIGGRVGGQPSYVAGGGVTRLQAGPFASRAAAEHACHASGQACTVLP